MINPGAGRRRRPTLVRELQDALARRGITVHVPPDAATAVQLARAAFDAGDGVVVCGGDGTVRDLAGAAADGSGGVVAVVPTGAGNDFARHLGLPHRAPLRALDLLDTGTVRAVDLGRAHTADGASAWFTTVAHAGLDAEAARRAHGWRFARGAPLYVLAAARTMLTYRPQAMRAVVDGTVLEGRAWLVAVGNTRSYAGGMRITPAASIDDGRLDVCVVGAVSRAELALRFPSVFRGTHTRIDGVHTTAGRVIELSTAMSTVRGARARPLDLYANGERVGPLPARVEVVPGVLRVLTPTEPAIPLSSPTPRRSG